MDHRWLGGILIGNSFKFYLKIKELDEQLSDGATGLTKKDLI